MRLLRCLLGMFTMLALTSTVTCVPIARHTTRTSRSIDTNAIYSPNAIPAGGRPSKKDVFVSRGWGAGGMPFSVLYMSPYSSKAPVPEDPYRSGPMVSRVLKEPPRQKSLPQVRTAMGSSGGAHGGGRRKPYSIIPQLFVSYGWGPLGK